MKLKHLLTLIFLGAIWGGSFLFLRLAVGDFGPNWMIFLRALFGAVCLFGVCSFWIKTPLDLKENLGHYAILGALNTAVPFLLFGYASLTVPASLMAVLNATVVVWATFVSAIWERKWPPLLSIIGAFVGVFGVAVLIHIDVKALKIDYLVGIFLGLLAAFCYGFSSVYSKYGPKINPINNAHGSLWFASAFLLPSLFFTDVPHQVSNISWAAVLIMGLVSTGLAFFLFYRLIDEIGAAQATSVAYLIPVFGVLWGALILKEPLDMSTLLGGGLILCAVALINQLNPFDLIKNLSNKKA